MREAKLDEVESGIKIGGNLINNLRYADDTTLLAETKEGLQEILKNVKDSSVKNGLYLNLKKTNVMATEEITEFNIDNEKVEIVNDFIFLGSKIQNTGTCDGEIVRRLALGRAAMSGLTKIWRSKDIGTKTKIRIVNALVFPVTMYGCESWTMRQSERKKIDSFELWCWRRLLRIPWTPKRTNVSILEEIKPAQSLESLIIKQKLSYFGHIMRKQNSLEKSVMLGMGEGERGRGRPSMRWKDDIERVTGLGLSELARVVENRDDWRQLITTITRSRPRLDGTR